MKRLLFCWLPLLLCAASATAQVHAFKAFGSWSRGVEVQPGFTSATAWGLGAAVRFDLGSDLLLTVTGGYEYYSLDQDSALQRWNFILSCIITGMQRWIYRGAF